MLQEGKLRHKGGLEVVGPAFQVLQLQGPSSELIPPSVITAELAMRKVRSYVSRGAVPVLFLFIENSKLCLLRESFSTASLNNW